MTAPHAKKCNPVRCGQIKRPANTSQIGMTRLRTSNVFPALDVRKLDAARTPSRSNLMSAAGCFKTSEERGILDQANVSALSAVGLVVPSAIKRFSRTL